MRGAADDAVRSCRRIAVTEVTVMRGDGTEDNPLRQVTRLYDDDGRCLAEHDPLIPQPWWWVAPLRSAAGWEAMP